MRGSNEIRTELRGVEWRDLVPMRRRDGIVECLHPAPWLFGSWALAALALWPAAIACSFMFFLTALRLNHEAIHGNLGFSSAGHRRVLHALSALMLGSNSAVAFNHLQHHAHLGTPKDLEGKAGRMSGPRVLAYGPFFPIEQHSNAWRSGGAAIRRRMRTDLALNLAILAGVAVTGAPVLVYHVLVMVFAQCLTAFFAVWITHRHCEADALPARTQRSWLVNFASYNMFFHLEHHLFPAVPVRRLARLAERIDRAAPDFPLRARRVVEWPHIPGAKHAPSRSF